MAAQVGVNAIHTPSGLTADILRGVCRDYADLLTGRSPVMRQRSPLREVAAMSQNKMPHKRRIHAPRVPPLPMNAIRPCVRGSPLLGIHATTSEAVGVGRASQRPTSPQNLSRLPLSCEVTPPREASPLPPTTPQKCPPPLPLASNRKAELVGKTSPLRQMAPSPQNCVSSSPLQSTCSRQWLRRDSPPAGSHPVCASTLDDLAFQDRRGSLPGRLNMRSSLPASRPRWGVSDGWHEKLQGHDSRSACLNGEHSSTSGREVARSAIRQCSPGSAIRQCSPVVRAQRAVLLPTK